MDDKNWRVGPAEARAQGQIPTSSQVINGEVAAFQGMEAGDWSTQLQADFREMIVNKMMDALKSHLPFSGRKGLQELKKIAARFEEMYFTSATSQSDYLAKICLKMLTMETSQNPMANSLQSIASDSQGMQPQVQNQVQQLPPSIPMVSHQTQVGLSSFDMSQDSNMQNIPDMSTATPNVIGTTSQPYTYHEPVQNCLLKRKLSQESVMQPFLPINLPIIDQQHQSGPPYISVFQKHQMVDIQYGNNSGLQNYQKPSMPHQSRVTALQQNMSNLLPNKVQCSNSPQPQQGFPKSSSSLHQQTTKIDQQNVPLNSSSHAEKAYGGDWEEEEIFRKIISMDDMYFPELNEIFQGMSAKLPQENQVGSEVQPTNALCTTLQHDFTHSSSSLDNTHVIESTIIASGNSNVVEQPLQHLIKVVRRMSKKALSGSVSDISSVVSMVDRISGSGPGNGSRAALGEDLVAMTKSHLLAQDKSNCPKKMRRYTSAVPSSDVSSA